MTAPEDLQALLGPPATQPSAVNWPSLSSGTGLTFPADYRAFAAIYPAIYIDEFITVFHPGAEDERLNLIAASGGYLDAIRELNEMVPGSVPYPVYPELGGIFPWGVTSNGDWLFWRTEGEADTWPIVGTDGGAEWIEFDGTMSDFLVAALSRALQFELFPETFPRPRYSVHNF